MGSSPNVTQQIQSAPTPTPTPPVSQTSSEVVQAQQDIYRENLLKKGIKSTIYAGDTGGWNPNPVTAGTKKMGSG